MTKLINPEPNTYKRIKISCTPSVALTQFDKKINAYHIDDDGKVSYYVKIQ